MLSYVNAASLQYGKRIPLAVEIHTPSPKLQTDVLAT